MRAGFAADDGVALHFRGTRLQCVVSSRPQSFAYRVEPDEEGVVETRLDASYLGREGAAPELQCAAPALGSAAIAAGSARSEPLAV
jgi:hypothetical protein